MRFSAVPLACYAALIGTTAAVQWVWSPYVLPSALLTGGAVVMLAIATVVAIRGRHVDRRTEQESERPIPNYSFSILALAYAIPTMLVGAYLGLYLILIGGGVLLLGIGGLIREWRAERRSFASAKREQAGAR
jgi:hypothetical protein